MTQLEAVYQAIEELGDRTRLDELAKKASSFYGERISKCSACTSRLKWRKEVGSPADCRTYESQPRRNQYRDDEANLKQVKELAKFANKGNQISDLINLLNCGKFHSIEQLKFSLNELAFLKAAA